MNNDNFDSEITKNDDMNLPLNVNTVKPNWWSLEHYELILKKQLGLNRLLTHNEQLAIRVILCFVFFGITIGYYSSVESWSLNDCCYFLAVSLSVSFY